MLPGKNLTGTTLNSITPDPVSPGTFDITFSVFIYSPDFEYADRVEITLPTGWTINSVTNEPENTFCSCNTIEGYTGQMVWWQIDDDLPSGYGSWYGLTDFVANVTVPDCTGAPWDIDWTVIGDGYGDDPHTVSDTYSLDCNSTPPTYVPLTPTVFCQVYNGSFDEGDDVIFELNLQASKSYHFSLCADDLCCGGEYTGDVDGDLTMYDAAFTQVWYIDGESSCNYNASTKPDYPDGWTPATDGTYYLMVDDYAAVASSAFTLAYQIASVVLTPSATCETVTGSFGPGGGVYYEMYLTTDKDYNFSTCDADICAGDADGDNDFTLYDESGTQLWNINGPSSCAYHATTYGQPQQDWTPPADGCYYLYVDESGTGFNTINYTLAYISVDLFVLPNDLCADAITVICGDAVSGTTSGATSDSPGACNVPSYSYPGVWYHFAGNGGMVSADLCTGTSWDSEISVYEGSCGSLICVDGNDDYCSLQSRVDWYAANGTDYYILVHQYGSSGGSFTLTVDCTNPASATWQGDDNTDYNDWFGADNWDVQDVPGSSTDVIIPEALSYYPTIDREALCNDISFNSSSGGTSTLLDNGFLTVTGTASVERYFTGDPTSTDDWHLVSSPVTAATAQIFMDMYLQSFDEATHSYTQIVNPVTPLNVMEGYALYSTLSAENTVTFSGNLNFGVHSNGYTANDPDPNPDLVGWNLLGNPFVSSIDWEAVIIPPSLSNEVHYIEAVTGNDLSYVKGTGGSGSRYIAPMQGFFVKASGSGTLTFDDDVRSHNGSDIFYKAENPQLLILKAEGENFSDEAWIHFNAKAGVEHDGVFDAYKRVSVNNPLLPQIYSLTPAGSKLSVNGLPETVTVPVGFAAGQPGEFTITAVETSEFTHVFLEDLSAGIVTNLLTDSYTFNYGINEPDDRFIVHFTPLSVSEITSQTVNIYSQGKDVYVMVPANADGNIILFDIMGQEIARTTINGILNKVSLSKSAYYIVEVISEGSVVTKKVFVK